MLTSAREAIRIAEMYFPTDLRRQMDLAKDIVKAIELCELELGRDIIHRVQSQGARPTREQ